MLKKIFIPLIAFVFFSTSLFSQVTAGIIKGRIVDFNNKPIPNANIQLKLLKNGTITIHNGSFKMTNLPSLTDTIVIFAIGYQNKFIPVKLSENQEIDLGSIILEVKVVELQSVEISGRKENSYKSDYSFYGTKTQTQLIDIPQSISTITKEIIKDKMVFTVKDAVEGVAGLNQYSGYEEFTIRGLKADNAHDINGLRSYNTTYTSNLLVNIERIEVIKGPTATLYGNCDPGGTINMVTKKPLDKPFAEIDLYTGSWNHFRLQGDISGPLNASKTLLYRFNAGFDSTKSFRAQVFNKSYQIAPSLSFVPNNRLKLNFDFSYAKTNSVVDRGQPGLEDNTSLSATPISLSLTQPGDYLHQSSYTSIFSASYQFSKNLTFSVGYLNFNTSQNVADHGFNSYITPDSVNLYYTTWNYHTVTNTLTNYLTYKFNTGKLSGQILAGYDYIHTKVNLNQQYFELPDEFDDGSGIVGTFSLIHPKYVAPNVHDYELSDYDNDATAVDGTVYQTQGIYLQNQLNYKKWKLLFSLREELYRGGDSSGVKENVFLPRLGLVYAIRPNLNAYVTYNKGFDPFEASTSLQIFNEAFKPVTSTLLETGVKGNFFQDKLSASISLYQLTLNNVAVNANDASNPDLFVQRGEEQSTGIEAEAIGNILPNLSISLAYSYCDAKITQSLVPAQIGQRLENAPLHSSSSWIKYTFNKGQLKGFGLALGSTQESERNTLDADVKLPGYMIFKGELHYTANHFTVAVVFNNFTNQTYWVGAYNNINKWPGQPANYLVNIGYRF
jgi:iron complex outermembrane receptor protein